MLALGFHLLRHGIYTGIGLDDRLLDALSIKASPSNIPAPWVRRLAYSRLSSTGLSWVSAPSHELDLLCYEEYA
jgi:hypothetical protein